jgi:DNA mismatch repair protein MutL
MSASLSLNSMKPVQILDPILANQIAAGEVVERPASAVKELLENALDAGSTSITLEIKEGGRNLIRVVDNGHGMSRDNALLAIERHATSKISTIDDLHMINTLGFRGEALPSIASVSKLSIKTRTANQRMATHIQLTGGENLHVSENSGRVGTEIKVQDLFFNVPARRKFLKSKQTETSMIHETIQRLSICYPQIAFRFIKDGYTSIDVPVHNSSIERLSALFGSSVVQQLHVVQWHGALEIEGFLSHPQLTYSAHRHAYAFINGRFVKDRLFLGAIQRAFGQKLTKGRFPFYVLKLKVHPSMVDVNVHPAKTEVRFANEEAILDLLTKALRVTIDQMKLSINEVVPDVSQWHLSMQDQKNNANAYQSLNANQKSHQSVKSNQSVNSNSSSNTPLSHLSSGASALSTSNSYSTMSDRHSHRSDVGERDVSSSQQSNILNKHRARIQARLDASTIDTHTAFESKSTTSNQSKTGHSSTRNNSQTQYQSDRHDVVHISQNDLQNWKNKRDSSQSQTDSITATDSFIPSEKSTIMSSPMMSPPMPSINSEQAVSFSEHLTASQSFPKLQHDTSITSSLTSLQKQSKHSHLRDVGRAQEWWIQEASDGIIFTHIPTVYTYMLITCGSSIEVNSYNHTMQMIDLHSYQFSQNQSQLYRQKLAYYGWQIKAEEGREKEHCYHFQKIPHINKANDQNDLEWMHMLYKNLIQQFHNDQLSEQSNIQDFTASYIKAVQLQGVRSIDRAYILQWMKASHYPADHRSFFTWTMKWSEMIQHCHQKVIDWPIKDQALSSVEHISVSTAQNSEGTEKIQVKNTQPLSEIPSLTNDLPPLEIDDEMLKKIF